MDARQAGAPRAGVWQVCGRCVAGAWQVRTPRPSAPAPGLGCRAVYHPRPRSLPPGRPSLNRVPAEGVCDRTAASRLSLGLTSDRFILNKTFRGARLLPRAAKASRCSADPEGGVKNHRTRRAPGGRATL